MLACNQRNIVQLSFSQSVSENYKLHQLSTFENKDTTHLGCGGGQDENLTLLTPQKQYNIFQSRFNKSFPKSAYI